MSIDRSDPDWPWPLVVRAHPRAKRLKLRLDTKRCEVVLTCPPRANRRRALAWAETQGRWVRGQIEAIPPATPFEIGSRIPYDGEEVAIIWDPTLPRTPRIDGGQMLLGGPRDAIARRVTSFLKREARRMLSQETAEIAARAGVIVKSVSVGDADTRWGSCSASGAIRFNWRLVMAPASVRRWVVAHEVAHRVHMNHGAEFHALEEQLYEGDSRAARSALRRIGPRLKRVGRAI